MNTSCIVLAAGKGSRFGMEKQYFSWRNSMLWQTTYGLARDISNDVVCVGLDIEGGRTRQESVKKGLSAISGDRVIVFEIVRPLVSESDVDRLLEIQHPSVTYGTKLETPVYDTASDTYLVPESASLIQNLQVFDTKLLREAHAKTKIKNASDDTILMHDVHGIKPHIITRDAKFLWKLTTIDDVEILNALSKITRW